LSAYRPDGETVPAGPGNALALVHGATSERQIQPIAHAHRRSVLRRFGLLARDLSAVQRGYLDLYVRCMAKLDLYDRWTSEHGWLDAKGNPPPFHKDYGTTVNSARLNLARLEQSLRDHAKRDPTQALHDYLDTNYRSVNGDDD
jgi:hypothetical protein